MSTAVVADRTISGAVLSVRLNGGKPWIGAAGIADCQQSVVMTPKTRIRIASISKVCIAVIALPRIEEGTLTLDTLDVMVEARLPDLVPNGSALIVCHLLSHTTRLYNYLENAKVLGLAYA